MKIYNITPIPKPRMTQSDRWKKRKSVLRYRAFKDEIKLNRVEVPESRSKVVFILPMPKSWSKKKRDEMYGKPHQQVPDVDNLVKALLDSIYSDDSHIYDMRASKLWGDVGQIHIGAMSDHPQLVDGKVVWISE